MVRKSTLSSIAKKGNTATKKTTPTGNKTVGSEEKENLGKKKVEELLKDLPLNKEELLELDESQKITTDNESMEWLQEQLTELAEENEKLKNEVSEAKHNYEKLFNDYEKLKNSKPEMINESDVKNKVSIVFNELQTNHFKMGRNFTIVPIAFMNRLIMYFPFLEKERKY